MPNDYHQKASKTQLEALRKLQSELPDMCIDYFIAIEPQTGMLTRLAYAHDLKIFFQYLSSEVGKFEGKPVTAFTSDDMKQITKSDIERYTQFLSLYYVNEESDNGQVISREIENSEYGKMRKLSALRSLFKYLYADGKIDGNVVSLVPLPKRHEHAIIRLDVDEVARILDEAESGEGLSGRQKKYHQLTQKRDLAMLTLFLGTGIRVSECVSLNIEDFDFEQNAFVVTRKGGQEVILYISDEIAAALKDYLVQRREIEALPGHENAFFLSIQRRRITQRAVENLVKKYAAIAAPLKKKISPHKLRSTFGTNLYRETGDIYLVADVLGHSDVNTTRRHYAAMAEDRRREAANHVILRDDAPKIAPVKPDARDAKE